MTAALVLALSIATGSGMAPTGVLAGKAPNLDEFQLVLSDPPQVQALARRKSQLFLKMAGELEASALPPRASLSEPTREWLDKLSFASITALLVTGGGTLATGDESAQAAGRVDALVEAIYSRVLVRQMVAQFPRDDPRLGQIIEGTVSFEGYSAAGEALSRFVPEDEDYFTTLLRGLDPLTQALATSAALGRVHSEPFLEGWLAEQAEEALSLIGWEFGDFPEPVRSLARGALERLRPTVDWDSEIGGRRRRDVGEFFVSVFSEGPLALPAGAFDFLVARMAAEEDQWVAPAGGEGTGGVRVLRMPGLSTWLRKILLQDKELARQVLLQGGSALYSSPDVASIVAIVDADAQFFHALLGELSLETQPLLVTHAVDRLGSRADVELWLDSLGPRELGMLANLVELLNADTRAALEVRLQAQS